MKPIYQATAILLLLALLGSPIVVAAQEVPTEPSPEGGAANSSYVPLRIKVVVKNGSSFRKMLTVYDNNCRRHLLISKRFQAWGSETVTACTNDKGLANITVDRLGLAKKQFRQVKRMATIRY